MTGYGTTLQNGIQELIEDSLKFAGHEYDANYGEIVVDMLTVSHNPDAKRPSSGFESILFSATRGVSDERHDFLVSFTREANLAELKGGATPEMSWADSPVAHERMVICTKECDYSIEVGVLFRAHDISQAICERLIKGIGFLSPR